MDADAGALLVELVGELGAEVEVVQRLVPRVGRASLVEEPGVELEAVDPEPVLQVVQLLREPGPRVRVRQVDDPRRAVPPGDLARLRRVVLAPASRYPWSRANA